MSGKQGSLDFPVRKSSRRKLKADKENKKPEHKTPQKQVVTPTKRSTLPSEINACSPSKRRFNKQFCDVTVITPFSPSKRINGNSASQSSVIVSAKKQLVMDSANDPLLSHDRNNRHFTCESPRKFRSSPRKSILHSPSKSSPLKDLVTSKDGKSSRIVSSPRKSSLNYQQMSPEKTPESTKELFAQAKQALNTQQPEQLVCRDKEMKQINRFLDSHIDTSTAGSLYISGAPGTGKTAVIKHLLEERCSDAIDKIFINSMTVKSPFTMYKAIATELLGPEVFLPKNAKLISSFLCKTLTTTGRMVVLVLDELDQLDCKHQEVLYTMFEWPSLPHSRLILIGIANALDLTDRILPRLNVRANCKPELLHFPPYTRDQIVTVIESRLQQTPEVASRVLEKSAMLFCARKVSAVAGDMRKALDICRRSVEIAQISERKEELLQEKEGATPSTSKRTNKTSTVGIVQVAKVVDEVYGSAHSAAKASTFPLQQKLIACTLLLMLKSSKLKELKLGKVHDGYCRVCRKRDVGPTDQSEFVSLCQLLETRGLVSLKKAKEARMTKISLKIDANELEFALKDKLLISSVLEGGL